MKKYSVGDARAELASVLDLADRGVPVAIERRGVRYLVVAEPAPKATYKAAVPAFQIDEDLLESGFTWAPAADGGALSLKVGSARKGKRNA